MTDLARLANSWAVLIGVSAYEYAEFPPIRAARNSLQTMHGLLSDPMLCGWPLERIKVIPNPISAADVAVQIGDLAENTPDVMLFYYVGHGVLTTRGELCLALTSTRQNWPKMTGLAWEDIADVLRSCPAKVRITILDCCFAGQAIESLASDGGQDLADITHVQGVYTLTATTRNRTAHVPPPAQQDTECTSFTGELRDLIRCGIPHKPGWLTLGDIYPILRQRLRDKGLPIPNQRGTETAYQFPFTANAAHNPQNTSTFLTQAIPQELRQSQSEQARQIRTQARLADLKSKTEKRARELAAALSAEPAIRAEQSPPTSKYSVSPTADGAELSGYGSRVVEVQLPPGDYRLSWVVDGEGPLFVKNENGNRGHLIQEYVSHRADPLKANSGEKVVRIADCRLLSVNSKAAWKLVFKRISLS
jgi:Caspase domain